MKKQFLKDSGALFPIIGGAMYPCSNPELVAAVSNAGGIGIVQPITLTYVCGYEFDKGVAYIKSLTSRPIGMNVLIESSSARYQKKMQEWVEIALNEGVRFFVTSLGNPSWVVEMVHAKGGKVYHCVTNAMWASKANEANVDGLIAVNSSAGGHLGELDAKKLYEKLKSFELPIICAGGISTQADIQKALALGYDGVQMGTRFIATYECSADESYKEAIVQAKAGDITTTKHITGVDVSIIRGSDVTTTELGAIETYLFNHFPHLMRLIYAVISLYRLKKSLKSAAILQAGKSVEGIDAILHVEELFKRWGFRK